MHSNNKMEFLSIRVGQQRYPIQLRSIYTEMVFFVAVETYMNNLPQIRKHHEHHSVCDSDIMNITQYVIVTS